MHYLVTELYTVRDIFASGVKCYQPDVLRKREHVCLLIVLKLSALMVVIYLKGNFCEFSK